MQSLNLKHLIGNQIEAIGALDWDDRPGGISPRRLPAWTRIQLPQPVNVVARMPSGVRLRFKTDSARIGISFHATNMVTPPATRRPIPFTLEINGQRHARQSTRGNTITLNRKDRSDFSMTRGEDDTLYFDDLGDQQKVCELWLPHNAFVELKTLHLDATATVSAASADTSPKWIHHGSSISHCVEAEDPACIWPAVAARNMGYRLQNLGFGGQCHLDQFVARTIRDSDADIISVKTGINVINMDSMKGRIFEPTLHGFLDTVREGKPDQPIYLISAIFCPSAETNPGPTIADDDGKFVTIPGHRDVREGCMTLSDTRSILERVTNLRREAGDVNLHYINGLELFSERDAGDLPDDLHPNSAGYIRMGERFSTILNDLDQQ
jgi:hypothetical protein